LAMRLAAPPCQCALDMFTDDLLMAPTSDPARRALRFGLA
jgi:hypothetical protein